MAEEKKEATEEKKKKQKIVVATGKRKKAVARAFVREGSGRIRINSVPIGVIEPYYKRIRIMEAVMLASDAVKTIDINVNVQGGGVWSQADASRTAIANALVKWTKDNNLKHNYFEYDRSMLISDARRTERHRPSRSTAGPRRSKQQSKR